MFSFLQHPARLIKPLQNSLQVRLTLLILILAAPLLIAVTTFITYRADSLLTQDSIHDLRVTNLYLSNTVQLWLDANIRALRELTTQPDILSMEPARQRPVLIAMAHAYPHMYLVSTTDMKGYNVARSDDGNLTDYSDRLWFQQAVAGTPLTFQTLIGRTTGQPALVVSTPIHDATGQLIGVAMFATDLDDLTAQIHAAKVGEKGISFLVDANNQLIAHPNPELTANLLDFSSTSPVSALRSGKRDEQDEFSGLTDAYVDSEGIQWRYTANELDNAWIVVIQIPEDELLASTRLFQQLSWATLGILIVALTVMTWLVIGGTVRLVNQLTESAAAVASGDYKRRISIERSDELGKLAHAFNAMAAQVHDLITRLEERVRDRTSLLEKRVRQMQATAEVGRSITSLGELSGVLSKTTRLVSEKFGYYHTGIFLIDANREYAVLRASNSDGGQILLAGNHQLRIGETGIVGHTAQSGKARIALDVGMDAVYFDNPALPLTRSEMALPLVLGNEILGVLDVQSMEPEAFSNDDIAALQVLADQLAVAIKNAQLFEEKQQALDTTTRIYDQASRESWIQLLSGRSRSGFLANSQGVLQRVSSPLDKEFSESIERGSLVMDGSRSTVTVPLKVRGQVIGALRLKKPETSPVWDQEETNLVLAFSDQLSSALDSARLYADAQLRAARESLISDISMRISTTPQISSILGETAKELGQAISNASVTFQLVNIIDEAGAAALQPEDVGLREIRRYTKEGRMAGFMYQSRGKLIEIGPLDGSKLPETLAAGSPTIRVEKTQTDFPFMAIPVKLREHIIGILQIRGEQPVREWKESEISLAQSIADRAATAIENASLLAESQRRAAKERTIGEISAKFSSLVDVDNIVQTAIQELSRTLPDADVAIHIQQK